MVHCDMIWYNVMQKYIKLAYIIKQRLYMELGRVIPIVPIVPLVSRPAAFGQWCLRPITGM